IGHTSPAALSHTVIIKSIVGASGQENASQLLLYNPSVDTPACCNTRNAKGFGCWFSLELLPAEYALKLPHPISLSKASAKILRAELCVHKNKTVKGDTCGSFIRTPLVSG